MALGRLSSFNTIPRPPIRGENTPPSATGFESLFAPDESMQGGGNASGAPATPSPVTGLTSQANSMFGNVIGMMGGLAGLPSVTGLLGGLVGQGAGPLAGTATSLGGTVGAKLAGVPTNLGDLVTMALNSLQSTGRFPLSLNPAAPASTTIGETGLNAGQLANALGSLSQSQSMAGLPATADPTTPFGLANITSADLSNMGNTTFGSLGPNPSLSPATAFASAQAQSGNFAGNPYGHGHTAPKSQAPMFSFAPPQARPNAPDPTPDDSETGIPSGLIGIPTGAEPDAPDTEGVDPDTGLTPSPTTASDGNDGDGGNGPGGPGVASGSGEAGIGSDGVGSGGPGTGPGEGSAGGTGGAGTGEGSDGSGNYHEGGFVDLERDGMGGNTKNSPDEGEKEVDATLEEGEFVVNKQAAGRFGPLLNTLNNLGRNAQLKNMLKSIIEGGAQMGFEALGKIK